MAILPCKFLYENAEKYFKDELDDRTKHRWECTLKAHNKMMNNSNDDWLLYLPIISAFFAGKI